MLTFWRATTQSSSLRSYMRPQQLGHHFLFSYTKFLDCVVLSCDAVMLAKSAHEDRRSFNLEKYSKWLTQTVSPGTHLATVTLCKMNNVTLPPSCLHPEAGGCSCFEPSRFWCQESLSAMIEWTNVTFHHQAKKTKSEHVAWRLMKLKLDHADQIWVEILWPAPVSHLKCFQSCCERNFVTGLFCPWLKTKHRPTHTSPGIPSV